MKKIILLAILLIVLAAAPKAMAISQPNDFTLNYASPLFDVKNAAPGQEFPSPISITNKDSATQNLQLQLNITTDPAALANFLYLKVEDGSGQCLWNCNETQNLSQINGDEMIFSDIPGYQTENYILVLHLSSSADDTLANAAMTFDMTLGFAGNSPVTPTITVSHNRGSSHNHHSNHHHGTTHHTSATATTPATNTGQGGLAAVLAAGNNTQNQNGNNGNSNGNNASGNKEPGQIRGASTSECHGWPLWVWILALIVFFLVLEEDLRRKYQKEKVDWKSPLLWIVLAIAFWYYFDACRTAGWFLYVVIILGVLGYSAYLEALRRKMKLGKHSVESAPAPFPEAPETADRPEQERADRPETPKTTGRPAAPAPDEDSPKN